jgi:hypothetical protein
LMSSRANYISDLQETLKQYRSQATDLDFDLLSCTWEDVLNEMKKAEAAASESHGRETKFHAKAWKVLDVMSPALEAIPDELCILHGGIALIFSVSSQKPLRLTTD